MPSKYVSVVTTNRRPGEQEDERREPEREGRDDAEREVDRRADGAVGRCEEARGADAALDRDEGFPAQPRRRVAPWQRRTVHSAAIKAAGLDVRAASDRVARSRAGRRSRSGSRGNRVDDHPAGALAPARPRASCSAPCPRAGAPASASRSPASAPRSPRARSGGRPRPGGPSRPGPRTRWPRPAHCRAASITAWAVASASGSGALMSRCCGTVTVAITRTSPPLWRRELERGRHRVLGVRALLEGDQHGRVADRLRADDGRHLDLAASRSATGPCACR